MKSPILLLSVLAPFVASANVGGGGTKVQTKQGLVSGTVSSGVRQFLGVPYAVANRWEAPHPPPVRYSTLQAKEFGDSCPQTLTDVAKEFYRLTGIGDRTWKESEDCLTANIWTRSTHKDQKAAVMIWVYGGSVGWGTSDTPYFHGHNLVKDNEDVIVVTFNYRTNIFGQPSAPQLLNTTLTTNFAILDLRAVVEWVYENIEEFGGDPERIVLFGGSAGGLVVDSYMYAFPNDTIVKGLIEQSGSFAGLGLFAPGRPNFSAFWNSSAVAAGCGPDPTPQQLACMRALSSEKLEKAVTQAKAAFGPVPDGITFYHDIANRSANGNYLQVPILAGNTAQEGDLYIVELNNLGIGSQIPDLNNSTEKVTKILYQCPAGTTVSDRTKRGIPGWRYIYEGVFPDISSRPDLRAYHTSEVPIVFGTYRESTFSAPPTPSEIALSKYIQSAWVAFARNPKEGLKEFGWPTFDASTKSLALLGNSAKPDGATFVRGDTFDGDCEVLVNTPTELIEEIFTRSLGIQ